MASQRLTLSFFFQSKKKKRIISFRLYFDKILDVNHVYLGLGQKAD